MLSRTSAVLSRYPLFWCDWMGHKMSLTFIWYRWVNCHRVTCTTYRWIYLSVNSDSNNFLPPISRREKIKILYHNRFLKFFSIESTFESFFTATTFFEIKVFWKLFLSGNVARMTLGKIILHHLRVGWRLGCRKIQLCGHSISFRSWGSPVRVLTLDRWMVSFERNSNILEAPQVWLMHAGCRIKSQCYAAPVLLCFACYSLLVWW